MTDLIAVVTTGKGTWGHVARLIIDQEWDKIILLTNQFGVENFKNDKGAEMILIDSNMSIPDLSADIQGKLKGKVRGVDVAVNYVSGSGKEHMALLSALLKMGLGIRLVALTREGIKEI